MEYCHTEKEKTAFILHCNEKYQPIGLTTPLQRLARASVAEHQAKATDALNQRHGIMPLKQRSRNLTYH